MATLVAIDFSSDNALLVRGTALAGGDISLQEIRRIPEMEYERDERDDALFGDSEEEVQSTLLQAISQELSTEVDHTLALLPSEQVVFEYLSLPFHDPRRLEQVVPLQVQDALPFDVDDFVIDTLVTGQDPAGDYNILSALAPRKEVASTLQTLARFGANPKLLSTRASAILGLAQLYPEELDGNYALLVHEGERCSVAVVVDNAPRFLREIYVGSSQRPTRRTRFFRDLRCTIQRAEKQFGIHLDDIYAVGPAEQAPELAKGLNREVQHLDLHKRVLSEHENPNAVPWAIGLFAAESAGKKQLPLRPVDFRQGNFAYNPTWGNIKEAVSEDRVWLIGALCVCLLWLMTTIYTHTGKVGDIEDVLHTKVKRVFPTDYVPPGGEVDFVDSRISELESQLSGLGSISSLSPLESLKELSEAISDDIDISVEEVKILSSGLTFRGTVRDFPSVGALDNALQARKKTFCNVTVDPGRRDTRSSRVKFNAEIQYCE